MSRLWVIMHYPDKGKGEYVTDPEYGKSVSYTLPTHMSGSEIFIKSY